MSETTSDGTPEAQAPVAAKATTISASQLVALLQGMALEGVTAVTLRHDQVEMTVKAESLSTVGLYLHENPTLVFEQLVDVCGIDYLQYGRDEWATDSSSSAGFSRGVSGTSVGRLSFGDEIAADENAGPRFAVSYQLLSVSRNCRLRLKVYAEDDEFPIVPSMVDIWSSANWAEREAFDLFGIHFEGHPDLRRLLTDYGFVGHPFRKDFPLVGNVEMRYDPQRKRVIYEPVSIEPRVLVPRVIRKDNRYVSHTESDGQDAQN